MSDAAAQPEAPTGYHLLLPPGWRGFAVDEQGLAEAQGLVSARFRELGRPDLDAQMRKLLQQQWQGLRKQLARQVFMQAEQTELNVLPMSIAVRQFAARGGTTFEAGLATVTNTALERIDTPIGPVFRGEREQRGAAEFALVRSVTVLYGLPLPEPHHQKGLAFIGSVSHVDETDDELIRGHVELLDTILETVRWR